MRGGPRHGIRHGNLGDALPLVFAPNGVFGGRLRRCKMGLDRRADRREAKAIFTDAMEQLDDVGGFGARRQCEGSLSRAIDDLRDVGIG